ncbi:MAG: RsiW-degrading membrane proteinase PrsW (M82 family), partial [Myxococcota bacterium]
MSWIAFGAAVAPALFLVWYFASKDVFPEPLHMLVKAFFWGIVIIIPVLMIGAPVQALLEGITNPYVMGVASAFLTAAIPEEAMKLYAVHRIARSKHFDEPMDGIVYAATASLGFACFENVLYVMDGGIATAVMRAVTAVPAHALFGVVMGWYVAQARFGKGSARGAYFRAFLIPMIFHGIYDTPLLALAAHSSPPGWLVAVAWLVVIGVIWWLARFARVAVRDLRANQLRDA